MDGLTDTLIIQRIIYFPSKRQEIIEVRFNMAIGSSDPERKETRGDLENQKIGMLEKVAIIAGAVFFVGICILKLHRTVTDIKVKEEVIKYKDESTKNKKLSIKLQSLLTGLLSLFAAIETSVAVNMITSNPPDIIGYLFLVSGSFTAIVAICMTLFLIGDNN
jgi:hypothetical protein